MKRLVGATMVLLLFSGTVTAAGQGRGKDKKQKETVSASRGVDRGGSQVAVHVSWGARDVQVIRTYYAPQRRSLPPGLAKKYARTGQLPPGWQKKMRPMPIEVERRLPPLPPGYRRGVIDAHAVIYNPSGLIVDVAVLF